MIRIFHNLNLLKKFEFPIEFKEKFVESIMLNEVKENLCINKENSDVSLRGSKFKLIIVKKIINITDEYTNLR